MRQLTGDEGHAWDVVVGRGSWGVFTALFIPRGGEVPARQAHLRAGSMQEAEEELGTVSEDELRELLRASSERVE